MHNVQQAFMSSFEERARNEMILLRDAVDTLTSISREMFNLLEERKHYTTPYPDSERPSFRTLEGCVGEALNAWKEAIKKAEAIRGNLL